MAIATSEVNTKLTPGKLTHVRVMAESSGSRESLLAAPGSGSQWMLYQAWAVANGSNDGYFALHDAETSGNQILPRVYVAVSTTGETADCCIIPYSPLGWWPLGDNNAIWFERGGTNMNALLLFGIIPA